MNFVNHGIMDIQRKTTELCFFTQEFKRLDLNQHPWEEVNDVQD